MRDTLLTRKHRRNEILWRIFWLNSNRICVCEFGELIYSSIRDRIVCGIRLNTGKKNDWAVWWETYQLQNWYRCSCKRAKINSKQQQPSRSYSGHAVETCGEVQTTVKHKDKYFDQIVDNELQRMEILKINSKVETRLSGSVLLLLWKKQMEKWGFFLISTRPE